MLKISDAVQEAVFTSPLAMEALRTGVLNLSAYASQIQPQVEAKTWKSVKKNSIVVALTRLVPLLQATPPLVPAVHLDELSIKAPLSDITYEKTARTLVEAASLLKKVGETQQFLTITQGVDEITVLVASESHQSVLNHFSTPPKSVFNELVGVSVRFSNHYLTQPNVIYAIISVLAHQRINLVEIVSTYTELTMILDKKDLELAVAQLQTLFR